MCVHHLPLLVNSEKQPLDSIFRAVRLGSEKGSTKTTCTSVTRVAGAWHKMMRRCKADCDKSTLSKQGMCYEAPTGSEAMGE
jgi:hypothetical protein